MKIRNTAASIAMALLVSNVGFGHARQLTPVPRLQANGANNPGLKTGPCGGLPRANGATATYEIGKTYTMVVEETIQHPGFFRYNLLDANDANPVSLNQVVDDINRGTKQISVTFPTTLQPCDSCTLQMIQVMTENPAMPSFYYSCANIKLVPPGGSTGGNDPGNGGGTPPNGGSSGGGSNSGNSGSESCH